MKRSLSQVFVLFSALFFSGIAGYSNGIGLVGFTGESVSYVTGNLAQMTLHFSEGDRAQAIHLMVLVIAFGSGALVSGMMAGGGDLNKKSFYGVLLWFQGLLFLGSIPILSAKIQAGEFLVSMACGMQNGMVTSVSGAVVRTTHMTGIVTDIGLALGKWARSRKVDSMRLTLHLTLMIGFLLGGATGIHAYAIYGVSSLWLSSILTLIAGTITFFLREKFIRILN